MKKISLLKLLGVVVLTMTALVACSFIEVAFYAYLVNPGQSEATYEKHAEESAPIVSMVGGFIIFFLVVRYWKLKKFSNSSQLVYLYPVVYLVVDLLIILMVGTAEWSSFIYIFLISAGAKFLGSFTGAWLTKTEHVTA